MLDRTAPASALDGAAVRHLANALLSEIVRPGDADYDGARKISNAAHERYPSLIVCARDAVDVSPAVGFARESGLPVAVRSGGHSSAGHGSVDGALVIDLSRMEELRIDLDRRLPGPSPASPGASTPERLTATAWRPRRETTPPSASAGSSLEAASGGSRASTA
jgi:hypothetical protein